MKAIADRGLQDGDSIAEAVTDANSHTIPATSAAYVTKAAKIRVFPNVPVFTLPSIPQLLTGQLAADGDPSLLIRLLASSEIDISLFSIQHRDRLAEPHAERAPAPHRPVVAAPEGVQYGRRGLDGLRRRRGQVLRRADDRGRAPKRPPRALPPGSGAVFYEWNPAEGARGGKMPKVVDPYIRDWSGQMVQNPNAQFQMCSDQMGGGRMDPYTLSGGPMAPPAATWGANVLSQAYQKTKRR
eukprot:jgi/Mesvir1/25906/Mv13691-RA.1